MDILAQIMSRVPGAIGLWSRLHVGSVSDKVHYGVFPYRHYAYGVYWSAVLAARLKKPRMTAIEFGVAGGRGLIRLERIASEVSKALGVEIDVVGFDTGNGMPPPVDYRDLPHIWNTGFYKMEEAKLRSQLKNATLKLGDVRETVPQWCGSDRRAPVGFVSFDLDYYSSTKAALTIFDGSSEAHLPRVHCYFDDLASNDLGCMNEYVGEHLAIAEFNEAHEHRKICRVEQLRLSRSRWESWQDRIYAFHDFLHPDYTTMVISGEGRHRERPL